jgi:hypothetical protein
MIENEGVRKMSHCWDNRTADISGNTVLLFWKLLKNCSH